VIYDARLGELRLFVPGALSGGEVATRVRPSTQRQNPRGGARNGDRGAEPIARPASRSSAEAPEPAPRTRSQRRVVVDAGHGGPDRGMGGPLEGGPRIAEKEITLAVAKRVAAALRARGVDVVMTRTTDTLIALADRGRIANASRADLFLSIHVNAANMGWKTPGAARGFETYFLAEAKTEDARRVEQMENEAVRFETGADAPRGDPLSFIINDMAQNEHLRESSDLASAIQQGLGRMHPGPDRGVKQANFAVLRTSFMPAVLIELGFGTNREEAAFLAADAEQRRMAEAIAEATLAYLARYERRVGSGGR
jgi:N-acetylmuramoyl-L-alanine amidase